MKKYILLVFIFLCNLLYGQIFPKNFFNHYELQDQKLNTFEIHVTKFEIEKKKPLLIYLDGSGNFPLYYKTKSGKYSTSISLDIVKYSKDYHVVLISKPNTPFSDSIQYSSAGQKFYPENDLYRKLYSLDWRAETASKAINFLVKKLAIDKSKIIVMGYSEGSQVAPKVAVLNKKVTDVVCFVGNSLNQLYDFIIDARLDADRGKITYEHSQNVVDSLYNEYEKIYSDPTSTKKMWYGETYLKWSSFTKTTPLENMLKLKIPILYIAGGRDNNQTIINMDYAKLEFARKNKTNLTYKVYPNCNHNFQELTVDSKGEKIKTDKVDEVHQFAVDWTKTH